MSIDEGAVVTSTTPALPPAVILAGGRALRMGGVDKGGLVLAGRPMLEHIVRRLTPQVSRIAVNTNSDADYFRQLALSVLPDGIAGRPGPLAGILAGLDWASTLPGVRHVVTVPCDTPFLPETLVDRLISAQHRHDIVCAASAGRAHPTVALWPVALAADLREALVEEGMRKVGEWLGRFNVAVVDFLVGGVDPFFNVNRPADLAEAERVIIGQGGSG